MWIDWAGTPRRHAPDFFVRFRNGSAAVIDVKPLLRIKPDDVEAFDWTSALCGELGWDYFVVHDISESEGRNLRSLSGYRYDRLAGSGECGCDACPLWRVPVGASATSPILTRPLQ